MRTGLLKIEGVEKVDVSLEKGLAHIELKPENKISLRQIEDEVKRKGFSPRGGNVNLKGRIQNKGGGAIIVFVSGTNESISGKMGNAGSVDERKEYSIHAVLKIDNNGAQSLDVKSAN